LTGGHVSENNQRSVGAYLGALREAIKENPRLTQVPAEEVARQPALEGRFGEELDASVVAEALESLEAEEQSFETEEIASEEANPT
jgi:hypothetical protein